MHQDLVIVVSDSFAAFEIIELDQEGTTCNHSTEFFDHFDGCFNGTTCCQEVIDDENALTWFDSISMHGQGIHTVFFFVVR